MIKIKKFLASLFQPKNSILLVVDHVTDTIQPEWEETIKTVKTHYQFEKLSTLLSHQKKNSWGIASLLFALPRKSVFLRAIPFLEKEEIPFTLFLDPEYVGLNRLPWKEEKQWYEKTYPSQILFSQEQIQDEQIQGESATERRNRFLKEARKRIGPLPIDQIDPTLFCATWGQILAIPPSLREFGLSLDSLEQEEPSLSECKEKLRFCERQLKEKPRFLLYDRKSLPWEKEILAGVGIEAAIDLQMIGQAIHRNTDLFQLPIWGKESADLFETKRI